MMTFYFFAFALERRIGGAMFAILYALGLSLSEFETYRRHRSNPDYATLGASGAISAVLFAAIVYNPTSSIFVFLLPIPIPAWLFAIGYLAYSYYSARHPHGRINHDAHLGGALAGLAFVAVTDPEAYDLLLRLF
jgi:membrane associated rhomboid family serine protease